MRKELAVLHGHVSVGGRVVEIAVHHGGDHASVGQQSAGNGATRRTQTVRVRRSQQAREAGESAAPVRIGQIVARPVRVSVLFVRITVRILFLATGLHHSTCFRRQQFDASQSHSGGRRFQIIVG